MKFAVYLIFCAAFLQCYALSHPDSSHDKIMGVSQKKLKDHIIKAFEGFRKIMPKGDEQLDYSVMDPYLVEEFTWDFVDTSSSKKYKLNFSTQNTTLIKGLSNFILHDIEVDAKDMNLAFQIEFQNLETEFPYKLEGYMLKNLLPIWGEGIVKLSVPSLYIYGIITLETVQSYIVVEHVAAYRYDDNIDIQTTGLMDLAEPFDNIVLDDVLDAFVKERGDEALKYFMQDLVEQAVGGMTQDELFDYLDYFVKISNQQ